MARSGAEWEGVVLHSGEHAPYRASVALGTNATGHRRTRELVGLYCALLSPVHITALQT